jgi:hypothetical protein
MCIAFFRETEKTMWLVTMEPLDSLSSSPPFLAGAGLEFTSGPFTLAPQFRYTRWIGKPVRKPNQWDILIGITLPAFHLGSEP